MSKRESLAAANKGLWRRISTFQLDQPAASLTFTRRLARENGWSHAFASRVVEEYKRFVYLAMTAGHEVTPSDEVDQAWHLHLTYTRSYWEDFCGGVLRRPLHHGPTKGGQAEGERFEDQYERTIASYQAAFGTPPPTDVWPAAGVRFGEAAGFVRVNRQRHLIFRKPRWLQGQPRLALGIAGVGVCGIAPLAANKTAESIALAIILGIALVVFIGAIAAIAAPRSNKKRRKNGNGSDHSFWGTGGCGANGGDDGGSGCGASGCGGGGCGGGCGS